MSKKSILSESTVRRFMKLSSLDTLSVDFLQDRADTEVQEEEVKLEEEKEELEEAEEVEEGKDLTAQGGNKETGATQGGDPAAGEMKALKEEDDVSEDKETVEESTKEEVQEEAKEDVVEAKEELAEEMPMPAEEDPMAAAGEEEELPMEEPAEEGGIDSAAVAGALQTLADALKAAGVDVEVSDNAAEDPAGEEDMEDMTPGEEEPAMELEETETVPAPQFDIDSMVNNIAESVMAKLAAKVKK